MTVTTDVQSIVYDTDGSTAEFPIPFYFLRAADITAELVDAEANLTELLLGTDFTVTGAGQPSGGALIATQPFAAGYKLHAYRVVPVTQESQYQQNDPFPAKTTEKALDKLTMLIQQQKQTTDRALVVPRSDLNPQTTLPSARLRANKALGFDNDGNPVPFDLTINSIIAPVVQSVAMLRLVSKLVATDVFVTDYYGDGKGGGGPYWKRYNNAPVGWENGGTQIVAADGAGWELRPVGVLSNRQFGARVDGLTDDTAANQKFVDYVTTTGRRGQFAPGVSVLQSMLTITIRNTSFVLEGAGADSSILCPASTFTGAGACVKLVGTGTYVGWRIGGFSVRPTAAGPGAATIGFQIGDPAVAAINILGYQFSTIFDVNVVGFTVLWQITHARMIRFVACAGWNSALATPNTALLITQNGAFTGDLLFDKCQFVTTTAANNSALNIQSTAGPYNNANGNCSIAGIKFRSCDFYAGGKALYIYASAQSYIADLWFVDGCQIDQQTINAFWCEAHDSGTLIENIHLDGMYANKSTGNTFSFASTGTQGLIKSVWVKACEILGALQNAMSFFGPGVQDVHVDDNTIVDCAIDGAAIEFNQCTGVKASNNKARTGLLNKLPWYLLGFDAGTTGIFAAGNDSIGAARVACIRDQSGVTTKIIVDNPGYNPLPAAVITVGPSPFSYTNNSGAPQLIQISGGTVSAVSINGWGLPVTASMLVPLPQGSTVGVTYSATPTMNSFGL